MKVSKKILSAVLCGLIVVGGSQASLVKANAQTQWSEVVGFKTHTKGFCGFTDRWSLNLQLIDGKLKLNGRTDIPENITFHDTYTVGWRKRYATKYNTTVFRPCWQASAGSALRKVEQMVNNANLGVGDVIFIHGERYNDSVTFSNPDLIKQEKQSRLSYNNYFPLYKTLDQHHTAFYVTDDGLEAFTENKYL